MAKSLKNSAEAYTLLSEYRQRNKDIPQPLLDQMAVFYLAPKLKKKLLNELFNHDYGTTPYYHRSWFWWQTLSTSGLGTHWDEFSTMHNNGESTRQCLLRLKKRATKTAWSLLSARHGITGRTLDPYSWTYSKKTSTSCERVWTKGGVWSLSYPPTQLLVLKTPLTSRNWTGQLTRSLIQEGIVTRLESELRNIIDPNTTLAPDCLNLTVQYVRSRIKELKQQRKNVSLYTVSWFLQAPVPDDKMNFYDYREQDNRWPTHDPTEAQRWIWW